jgi:hypothetical protein
VRRVLRLLVALVVLHAVWKVGAAYWTHARLEDEIEQIALFAGPLDRAEVSRRVAAAADRLQVPLQPDRIVVRREGTRTFIDASYDAPLEVLPSVNYPWTFRASAEGWAGALYERR